MGREKRRLVSVSILLLLFGLISGSLNFFPGGDIGSEAAGIYLNDGILEVGSDKEFKTITSALENATEGMTILVSPGIYLENPQINISIDLIGKGPLDTWIDGSLGNFTMIIWADNVMVSGFSIKNSGAGENSWDSVSHYDCGILVKGDFITINNCIFTNNSRLSIGFGSSCEYITIRNCMFYGNTMNHIRMDSGSYRYISIINNVFYNDHYHMVFYTSNIVENIWILNNEFIDTNESYGVDSPVSFSFWWKHDQLRKLTFSNNFVKGGKIGLMLYSGNDVMISHNTFENSTEFAIRVGKSTDTHIHHNNFINCNGGNVSADNLDGKVEWDDGSGSGNYWENMKILYPNSTGNGYVWDERYEINEGEFDNFPLTNRVDDQWGGICSPVNITYEKATILRKGSDFRIKIRAFDPDTMSTDLEYSSGETPQWMQFGNDGILTGTVPEQISDTKFRSEISISDGFNSTSVFIDFQVIEKDPLIGNWTFWSRSKSEVHDSSSYHNDGRIMGDAMKVLGLNGYALLLKEERDLVDLGNNDRYQVFEEYSISICIFPIEFNSQTLKLVSKNKISVYYGWGLNLYCERGEVISINDHPCQTMVPLNNWTQITVTHDGTISKLYINGELVDVSNYESRTPDQGSPLVIGNGMGRSGDEGLHGMIDEIKIYNSAISADEVGSLFADIEDEIRKYEYNDWSEKELDSDMDGLDDIWEILHFGNLTLNRYNDPDGDGYTNSEEFKEGYDPNNILDPDPNWDSDGDGLPDHWEMRYFSDLEGGPGDDPDRDGFSTLSEHENVTDPSSKYSHPPRYEYPDEPEPSTGGGLIILLFSVLMLLLVITIMAVIIVYFIIKRNKGPDNQQDTN